MVPNVGHEHTELRRVFLGVGYIEQGPVKVIFILTRGIALGPFLPIFRFIMNTEDTDRPTSEPADHRKTLSYQESSQRSGNESNPRNR